MWLTCGDELLEISFEFKGKQPATKMPSEIFFFFFFQKYVGKILQINLLCIASKLLLLVDVFLKDSATDSLGFFSNQIFQEQLF